jgi:Ca2+/Na+ antiporter
MNRWQRLKYTVVQPGEEVDRKVTADKRSVEDLQNEIRRSDDRERAIGLVAAPLAAIVGLLISSATINHARDTHQSVTVYDELTFVILGMSVLILVSSLLRKRLFQGITMALYGLAVFNLRFWGFGVPFLLAGAWYLVRAYRLQQALKRAEAATPSPPRGNARRTTNGPRPRPSKRYTPPS